MLKEDATSPTVTTTAVFLTFIINAWENRNVATVDIPGAFMHSDIDELVHIHFTGPMVEQLLEIDQVLYTPCLTTERGEKAKYVELKKALYGTMRAVQLFWD